MTITGSVYVLVAPNIGCHYIGSTKNSVVDRVSVHKSNYRQWLKIGGNCCSSKQIFKDIDWYHEIISVAEYETIEDLRKEESAWAGMMETECVNKNSSGGIDDMKEYHSKYYAKTKNKKRKCGCGSVVKYYGLSSHKNTKKHRDWYMESKWNGGNMPFNTPSQLINH